jgi:hypothetical protein
MGGDGTDAPSRWVLFFSGLPGLLLCWAIWFIPEPARNGSSDDGDQGWRALGLLLAAHRRFFFCHVAASPA